MIQKGSRLYNRFRKFTIRITHSDMILFSTGIFILFINPVAGIINTGCLFQKTTGFYCAGCGTTRAIYSLLDYDLSAAAHHNLLVVTIMPLSFIYIIVRIYIKKFTKINYMKFDKIIIIFCITTVLIYTIIRNIPSILYI